MSYKCGIENMLTELHCQLNRWYCTHRVQVLLTCFEQINIIEAETKAKYKSIAHTRLFLAILGPGRWALSIQGVIKGLNPYFYIPRDKKKAKCYAEFKKYCKSCKNLK